MLVGKLSVKGLVEARRLQIARRTANGGAGVPRTAADKVCPGLAGVEFAPGRTAGVEKA